ncbi:MAG TPA: anthranilate phosphoribosyltransferase [Caulobacteraceae bacterium]|nr:anthranilate phosphoribosyltransferase [Caulobacteraceae bacterium]
MSEVFKPLLARLADGATLTEDDAEAFFAACLRGEASPAQVAAAVTAMRLRGETLGEIVACARVLRRNAVVLEHQHEVIDVCGTGGDGAHTFNISTAVAFVVAGAGVKVAKHGMRAVSSRSGSSDVLQALGVDIAADAERQRRALDQAGVCFLFAPAHHGAMRHVAPVREELGFRTIFNMLGPLANPAGARRQLLGVFDPRWVEPLARALGALGAERAWVVHGAGLDEMTPTGPTQVAEWGERGLRLFTITPEAVGLERASAADLVGGTPQENALALRRLLGGEEGAYRDAVRLNAAAALLVADKVETLREGAELAGRSIDSGAAVQALERLVEITAAKP